MLLISSFAAAATLSGDHLAVGVASDGSLVDQSAWLGILHDPDGPGGDPIGTDLLLPGRAFESWAISSDLLSVSNSIPDGAGVEVIWDELEDNGFVQTLRGSVDLPGATVDLVLDLPVDRTVLYTSFVLTPDEALQDVWLSRTVDADTDYLLDGTYSTANGADSGVAWAGSLQMDKALAIATEGGQGGVCSWCSTPDGVLAGSTGESEGDYVVGVATSLGSVDAGESVEVLFVYGFGASVDDAVLLAEESASWVDRDGDGASEDGGDCDDRDPWVSALLPEYPDGLDNDCDGEIDEDTSVSDDDGDGLSEADGDCDDEDASVTDCPEADRPEASVIDELVTEYEGVPKGCSTQPSPGSLGMVVLLGLVLLRRRGEP